MFVQTVVDLSLRYPLLGGWKTDFVLGMVQLPPDSMCGMSTVDLQIACTLDISNEIWTRFEMT